MHLADETVGASQGAAHGSTDAVTSLGFRLGLGGYPREVTANGDTVPKTALQYIENHDHERFVCNLGTTDAEDPLLREGVRDRWYKVQPYLITLLTSCGIPMLWQGQELAENSSYPNRGSGGWRCSGPCGETTSTMPSAARRSGLSGTWWRFAPGCRSCAAAATSSTTTPAATSQPAPAVFAATDSDYTLVALNVGHQDRTVPFSQFPSDGKYREELHGGANDLSGVVAGQESWITIPSNYGRIWTKA